MEAVRISEKFKHIQEFWQPGIVGELNDAYIKLARLKGEFIWHHHEREDELFFVVKGRLRLQTREQEFILGKGEFVIVPHGMEHRPVADEEVHVILIEPKSTVNTGNIHDERTVESEWI